MSISIAQPADLSQATQFTMTTVMIGLDGIHRSKPRHPIVYDYAPALAAPAYHDTGGITEGIDRGVYATSYDLHGDINHIIYYGIQHVLSLAAGMLAASTSESQSSVYERLKTQYLPIDPPNQPNA